MIEERIYGLVARLILLLVPTRGRGRVSGEEAVRWENGYWTKDRQDLPYPEPRRLRAVR